MGGRTRKERSSRKRGAWLGRKQGRGQESPVLEAAAEAAEEEAASGIAEVNQAGKWRT